MAYKKLEIFDVRAFWITFQDDELGAQAGIAFEVPALGHMLWVGDRADTLRSGGGRVLRQLDDRIAKEILGRVPRYVPPIHPSQQLLPGVEASGPAVLPADLIAAPVAPVNSPVGFDQANLRGTVPTSTPKEG